MYSIKVLKNHGKNNGLLSPTRFKMYKIISDQKYQRQTQISFCTASGMSHVLAHINDRLACGESIDENSPVIAPDRRYNTYRGSNKNKPFLPTKRVSFCIRRVFRPRFQWRPYVLRAYFDTQMLIAESRGKVAGDFRAFFMGHRGKQDTQQTREYFQKYL